MSARVRPAAFFVSNSIGWGTHHGYCLLGPRRGGRIGHRHDKLLEGRPRADPDCRLSLFRSRLHGLGLAGAAGADDRQDAGADARGKRADGGDADPSHEPSL